MFVPNFEAIGKGGVEDTRLEAKAKDTKNFEAKDRPFRGQGQGHRHKVFSKKKILQIFFFRRSQKKGLQIIFLGDLYLKKPKKRSLQIFCKVSGVCNEILTVQK